MGTRFDGWRIVSDNIRIGMNGKRTSIMWYVIEVLFFCVNDGGGGWVLIRCNGVLIRCRLIFCVVIMVLSD